MLRSALLETDGTPEVMMVIQVFTQLFLQAHQNDNKQVSQDLFLNFPFQLEETRFQKNNSVKNRK